MNSISGMVFASGLDRLHADAAQEQRARRCRARAIAREGEAVADRDPQQRARARCGEALRHGGEHVLLAHHAAVEQRQARDRHHQHQPGRRRSSRRCRAASILRRGVLRRAPATRRGQSSSQRQCRTHAARCSVRLHRCPPLSMRLNAYRGVDVGLAGADAHGVLDGVTKILPSPICPVLADADRSASTTLSTRSDGTATSIRILGRKFTAYSAPR